MDGGGAIFRVAISIFSIILGMSSINFFVSSVSFEETEIATIGAIKDIKLKAISLSSS